MIYRIAFYFANLMIRLFYRKIYITGLDNIPRDTPLLLVSNHPNGFLEPIIMACTFPIDLHFLVRGDLFEKKSLRWLLLATNQIPIYRFRDGIAALRNNQKTISKTIEILQQNKAVIIFAEGSTNGDWHVRDMKIGMARMAFQCIDGKADLDLHILPIGVTFSQSEKPGTEVLLNVGIPIPVKDYYAKNTTEAKGKMEELTLITQAKVRELAIHLKDKSNESVLRSEWKTQSRKFHDSFLPRVKYESPFTHLSKAAHLLNEGQIVHTQPLPRKKLWPFLLLPLGLPGFLFWFIPIYGGFSLAKKYVKQREFVSSVRASASGGLCIIYLILFLPIMISQFGILYALGFLGLMFLSGFIMLFVWENYTLNDK